MATDFIIINRSDANAIFAGDLVSAARTADALYAALEKATNKMAEMIDSGPPISYTQIETLFGLPEGKGQAVQTVLSDLKDAMDIEDGPFDKLRSRLG